MSIHPARIQILSQTPPCARDYVLYWMQQSQRAEYNHALEYAIREANRRHLPLLTVFGLTDAYPDANLRHYTFMLEGLVETRAALADRGIRLVVRMADPPWRAALDLSGRAALVVCDAGYLRHQREWRSQLALQAPCPVIQVESDVIVPVRVASDKAAYAARTLRPRIHRVLGDFLTDLPREHLEHPSLSLPCDSLALTRPDDILDRLTLDRSVPAVSRFFPGGTHIAKARFAAFLTRSLPRYPSHSNQPQTDDISGMSPYLHFGQISPLYLALAVLNTPDTPPEARDAFLEQLIVRRELAMNFTTYTPDYDSFDCVPSWAQKTLAEHAGDPREYGYTRDQLAEAATHDPYWNAAMQEMRHTGYMHNYMRMYWGKKVIEWSGTPREAFDTLCALNNTWFLDGRDPNSWAGVAWLFGVHDRAWFERPVFGKIRYMSASGLKRKCDIQAYMNKVAARMALALSDTGTRK